MELLEAVQVCLGWNHQLLPGAANLVLMDGAFDDLCGFHHADRDYYQKDRYLRPGCWLGITDLRDHLYRGPSHAQPGNHMPVSGQGLHGEQAPAALYFT